MSRTELRWGDLGDMFDGPHATPERRAEGPYFLNIASLNSGRLSLEASDHVSREDFGRWTRRVVPQDGDLLFSYETRLGEAALMPAGVEACLGRRMALLRPNSQVVDSKFLLYYYLSPEFQETIARHTIHGATVPRIGLATMPTWVVSLPPLADQRAIAAVLGALDDKIAANSRLTSAVDALARAIVRSLMTGERVPLASLASVVMGSSPPGESYNESGKGAVFHQGVRDFSVRYPVNRVWTTRPVRTAEAGDTLVSVRAPVGRTNLAAERTCIGRGLAALRSNSAHPFTLFHLLRNDPEVWSPYEAEGTIFGSINGKQLGALLVSAIDFRVSDDMEIRLAVLEERIASAIAETRILANTRDTLLPLLMSGRVRVKDVEGEVEDVV